MNNEKLKILQSLGSTLEAAIPQFIDIKEAADMTLNKVIDQNMESQMNEDQKKILKGARNAYNLKGVGLDEKLEELTKIMKQCQHG